MNKNKKEEKPIIFKCIKCNNEKLFTDKYFSKGKNRKFGLKHICKDCEAEERQRNNYKKKGIVYNKITDINPEQWWEYLYKGIIKKYMPPFCYNKENQIKILRYIINKKMNLEEKEDIINNFVNKNIKKYKIKMMILKLGGKLNTLQKCFPKYNFIEKDFEFNKYTKEYMISVITKCLNKYNYSVLDILNGGFGSNRDEQDFKNLRALYSHEFKNNKKSINDMFLWYFNEKNIRHPIYNRIINKYDFNIKSNNYWQNKNNRIERIKYYCENECDENILNVISNTNKLKKWIYKYFKSENIYRLIPDYQNYSKTLYDLLIESYPQILLNKILFNWEWTQWNKYNNKLLLKMLRELVFYRLSDLIIDFKNDIPKYLNMNFMSNTYPKFNKHINRKRFESYYEWACQAFPEYANQWKKKDFGQIVSSDGVEFDSFQEKDIYEFIKNKDIFKYIKSIGRKRKGKYVFELNDEYEYEKFCPDFVIEYINLNHKKIKLNKPIIIEYYGMYVENHKNKIFQNYQKKTKIKEDFYKSRKDIYYIGIFPNDIKNNYEELTKKLNSFFISNFNINI